VRLNNNRITCLDGSGPAPPEGPPPLSLGSALGSVCADLKALRWLDLSFNNIVRGPGGMAPSRCVFLWAPRWSGFLAAFEVKRSVTAPRNIRVAAAAAPRPTPAEDLRGITRRYQLGGWNTSNVTKIREWVGDWHAVNGTVIVHGRHPVKDVIANYKAVAKVLRGTEFEWMLD